MISTTRKGKALGKVRSLDSNYASKIMSGGGSGQRGGMTITRVTGLGACMVNDLDSVIRKAKSQYKRDRIAMIREGSAS